MLHPLRILRSSSKITVVTAVSALLNFPLSIFVAHIVLPDQLGQINFVTLWLTYASLISLGAFSGGQREMIHRLGQGDGKSANQAQNVGFSGEMLWSLFPALVTLFASALFSEPLKRWGMVIITGTYLLATANKLVANLHLAHQRFDLYARFTLVRVVIPPVLIAVFILSVGPLVLLIAPLLAEGVLLALYLTRAPRLNLAIDFNRLKLREFIHAGLPLALATFVYWTYRLTGQSSVALWYSTEALAFYTFSATLVTLITRAFGDFSGVLMPIFWKELGQSESPQRLHRETTRISIFVMAATSAITNLAQAGFAPLVHLVAPRYVESIPIFEVLAFNITVLTMTFIPSLVLNSAVVNRQWPHLSVWAAGLGINIAANYLVMRLGGGLIGIAWNDIWVQLLVVVTLYVLSQQYLYPDRSAALPLYATLAGLMGTVGLVFIALRLPILASEAPFTLAAVASSVTLRSGFVLLIWAAIGIFIARTVFAPTVHRAEAG